MWSNSTQIALTDEFGDLDLDWDLQNLLINKTQFNIHNDPRSNIPHQSYHNQNEETNPPQILSSIQVEKQLNPVSHVYSLNKC